MNSRIELLDLSLFNCWIIFLKPNQDDAKDRKLQDICYEQSIFGMGWPLNDETIIGSIDECNEQKYINGYRRELKRKKELGERIDDIDKEIEKLTKALNYYKQIKSNDYILMRALNGHYYIGKVQSEKAYYLHSMIANDPLNELSWGCKVNSWHEIEDEEKVPSEIRGVFSQRHQSTIRAINGGDNVRLKMLIKSLYDCIVNNDNVIPMPKISYTKDNFASCLDYKQLEDLVYLYIKDILATEEGNEYIMLPSSCKTNQQKYEFRFIRGKNDDVTCQVKNKKELDLELYRNDPHFRTIYAFCGKWNEEQAKREKEKYEETNIIVILPSELYETLMKYKWLFNNEFCTFNQGYFSIEDLQQRLKNNDAFVEKKGQRFPKLEKILSNKEKIGYSCTEEGYVIFSNRNLFYAPETGKLTKSAHFADTEKENELCELILNKLNG
ncbi:MAG: hypothetical protein II969_15515 [Anaerolineaceae bacterium]|nr:hypothetical protein [Anaerolineaceae bacterium]